MQLSQMSMVGGEEGGVEGGETYDKNEDKQLPLLGSLAQRTTISF